MNIVPYLDLLDGEILRNLHNLEPKLLLWYHLIIIKISYSLIFKIQMDAWLGMVVYNSPSPKDLDSLLKLKWSNTLWWTIISLYILLTYGGQWAMVLINGFLWETMILTLDLEMNIVPYLDLLDGEILRNLHNGDQL